MRIDISSRRFVLLISLLVVLAVVPGVAAAETRSGGTVVVESGETVEGNLEAFAGNVIVRGTVTGDVNAFAGNVVIAGRVDGDVEAAAGNVEIAPSGSVGGELEAAAGNVVIAGTVDGDVSASGETIRVASGGQIGGKLQAAGQTIVLADGSSIAGDVEYEGTLQRAAGASVGGAVTRTDLGEVVSTGPPLVPNWVGTIYGFLVNLVFGAILLLLFPGFSRRVSDRVLESPLRTTGVGLLVLVSLPILLVLLAITIVGIPLSLVGLFLLLVGGWAGAVYGRFAVGTWLTAFADVENRWVSLLVGMLAVGLVSQVPFVGGLVDLVVLLLGVGALAMVLTQRYRRDEPETPVGSQPGDETGPAPG